jgi:glyoxylase-like metal-dependent hydrolase (beta-lactamase superfamily II)
MNVFPLAEGTYSVDLSKTFIPFDPGINRMSDRPASLVVDIVPFLIATKNELVVVDPGLGFLNAHGTPVIHEAIRKTGFQPGEVTLVLLSHLHKDHTGGLMFMKEGIEKQMFPRAKIYCQEKEIDFAFSKRNSPSYEFDKLEFLLRSQQLNYLNGSGKLDDEISFEVCGGHTPHHQVFHFSGEENFFFGGDVVPQASQLIRRFIAKYDFDGKRSAEKRTEFAQRGNREGWNFLFFHDAKIPVGKVESSGDRFRVIRNY